MRLFLLLPLLLGLSGPVIADCNVPSEHTIDLDDMTPGSCKTCPKPYPEGSPNAGYYPSMGSSCIETVCKVSVPLGYPCPDPA